MENIYKTTITNGGTVIEEIDNDNLEIIPIPQTTLKPTLEEQLEQIKQDNLILMDALATIYEAVISGGVV